MTAGLAFHVWGSIPVKGTLYCPRLFTPSPLGKRRFLFAPRTPEAASTRLDYSIAHECGQELQHCCRNLCYKVPIPSLIQVVCRPSQNSVFRPISTFRLVAAPVEGGTTQPFNTKLHTKRCTCP